MTLVKRLSMKDIHILIGDEDYFAQKVATAHAKDHKLTKTWNAIIVLESSGGVTVVISRDIVHGETRASQGGLLPE